MDRRTILRELRIFAGKTQKQVANETFIPYNTYRKYETGKISMGLNVIEDLSSYFKVPVSLFFYSKEEELTFYHNSVVYLGALYDIEVYKLECLAKKLNNLDETSSEYKQLQVSLNKMEKKLRKIRRVLNRTIKEKFETTKQSYKKHEGSITTND
jgi:transcriptional regulator with XRE-family HTH domain